MDAALLLRSVRRHARLSQRELANASGVPRKTIERIEAGETTNPGVQVLSQLVEAANLRLALVDEAGAIIDPDHEADRLRDRGARRFPAHLDVEEIGSYFNGSNWWGWHHIAWYWLQPGDQTHTYTLRRPHPGAGSDADGMPDGLGLGEGGQS